MYKNIYLNWSKDHGFLINFCIVNSYTNIKDYFMNVENVIYF